VGRAVHINPKKGSTKNVKGRIKLKSKRCEQKGSEKGSFFGGGKKKGTGDFDEERQKV